MTAQRPDTYQRPPWAAAVPAALIIAIGLVVVLLHHQTGNPHTAARSPASGSTQVNSKIEHRAQQFLAALRSGDEGRLRSMALTADDRDNVAAFVTAFGRRNDSLASLQTSDMGSTYGELEIAVPCRDGSVQHAIVAFGWKRVSFFSSNWFAIVNKPGTQDVLPAGCQAP